MSVPDIGPVFGHLEDYALYKTAGTVLGIGTSIAISMFGPGMVSCGTLGHKLLIGWEVAGAVGGVAGSVSNIVENGSVGVMDVLGIVGGVMSIASIGSLLNKCFVGDTLVIYGREDVFIADTILTVADTEEQWNTIGLVLGSGLLLAGGLGCSLEARREDKKKQFPVPTAPRRARETLFAQDDLFDQHDPYGGLDKVLADVLDCGGAGLCSDANAPSPSSPLEAAFADEDLFDQHGLPFDNLQLPSHRAKRCDSRTDGRRKPRKVLSATRRIGQNAGIDNSQDIRHTAIESESLAMNTPVQRKAAEASPELSLGDVPRRKQRAGKALVYSLLLLAGLCSLVLSAPWSRWHSPPPPAVATAADASSQTGHTQPRLLARPIRDVRPGQRVLAENPELAEVVVEPLEIEPDQWRLIRLKMAKPDGGMLSIELLRPVLWLQLVACETLLEDEEADDEAIDAFLDRIEDEAGLRGVLLGSTIELDLGELGAAGPAEVVEIASCSQIEEGEGRLVTGTFSHTAANVIDVHVSGLADPIGTTDTHPFWSEDRQAFVPAGELRIGEQLRSIARSQTHVTAIQPRGPPEAVFNLEVDGEHVYYVAESGLLVHNTCMKQTGFTKNGEPRLTAEWRMKWGPGAMRKHHLIPQQVLRDSRFIDRMAELGKDAAKFGHRQIARIANADHMRLHAARYNRIWMEWLAKNPEFTMRELLQQMKKMRKAFNIPAGSLGGPSY